jgi:hypothetical protein
LAKLAARDCARRVDFGEDENEWFACRREEANNDGVLGTCNVSIKMMKRGGFAGSRGMRGYARHVDQSANKPRECRENEITTEQHKERLAKLSAGTRTYLRQKKRRTHQ